MQRTKEQALEKLWLAPIYWDQCEAELKDHYGRIDTFWSGSGGSSSSLIPYDPALAPIAAFGRSGAESIVALFNEVQQRDADTAARAEKEGTCTLPYSAAKARGTVIAKTGKGDKPCTP